MLSLVGYTLVITHYELIDDYDDYANKNIRVYKTLKESFEAIENYLKDEDDVYYPINKDEFIAKNEGKIISPTKVVTIGEYLNNEVIIIKSLYSK